MALFRRRGKEPQYYWVAEDRGGGKKLKALAVEASDKFFHAKGPGFPGPKYVSIPEVKELGDEKLIPGNLKVNAPNPLSGLSVGSMVVRHKGKVFQLTFMDVGEREKKTLSDKKRYMDSPLEPEERELAATISAEYERRVIAGSGDLSSPLYRILNNALQSGDVKRGAVLEKIRDAYISPQDTQLVIGLLKEGQGDMDVLQLSFSGELVKALLGLGRG
ncbi:MAG: hypothetical protein GF334_09335 [Candidatus Altiarchaeales archaeon]|nr:hypothetical protein [Candidatus Altiarchaeales archaeon]